MNYDKIVYYIGFEIYNNNVEHLITYYDMNSK